MQPVGAAFHHGAHGLGGLHKADIALDRVFAYAQHFNAIFASSARGYCTKRYEVASG